MEYLFDRLDSVEEVLLQASRILILLDYDGTLTPIVENPGNAILNNEAKKILGELSGNSKFILGIISGRPLDEIKRLVGLEDIYYSGNHGLEASGPGFRFTHPGLEDIEDSVEEVAGRLREVSDDIKGVLIEDKGFSVVVHYRMVSASDWRRVREVFKDVVEPYVSSGRFRIDENKMTLELIPDVGWNKGDIVLKLLELVKGKTDGSVDAVYFGDDITDEDVFKALRGGGLSVVVGEMQSNADYYVRDVDDVLRFLEYLIELT
jgi:trehalose 6-phosphate phosphatase